MKNQQNLAQFISGIILALLGATLIFFHIYHISGGIAILIIGLIFIATSNFRLLK